MDNGTTPPRRSGRHTPSLTLNLLSSSALAHPAISTSPHRQSSQSPFRYVHFPETSPSQSLSDLNEKATPLSDLSSHASTSQQQQHVPSPVLRQPAPLLVHRPLSGGAVSGSGTYTRPRGLRLANLVKPWLPVIMYALSSLAFVVAIAFYRNEVFTRLDELSMWLRHDEQFGHSVLFLLIFITCFPPIPLYSTLITLSGYTFGAWEGAFLSYCAALTGAITVFLISRSPLLRGPISRWLHSTSTIKRVVSAIERRPTLLFLVRLAPYPYNVMNCLLAASPSLTFKTYTLCTAASLLKVIVHTSLGAGIRSFKDYHVVAPEKKPGDVQEEETDKMAKVWTIVGVVLCVAIFVYITIVARRAVDDELRDSDEDKNVPSSAPIASSSRRLRDVAREEETVAFLSDDLEAGLGEGMTELSHTHGHHHHSNSQLIRPG